MTLTISYVSLIVDSFPCRICRAGRREGSLPERVAARPLSTNSSHFVSAQKQPFG